MPDATGDDRSTRQGRVLAAGGIILRQSSEYEPRVVCVHRPDYDDWTFPKGKLDPGETLEDAALREVYEETGIRARLGRRLADVSYTDRSGRLKIVSYWTMEEESFTLREPDAEVDQVRWVDVNEARSLLTYPRDRELLTEALR